MSVCCECCVLSSRALFDGPITRPEESYRPWCVAVCDLETSWMRNHTLSVVMELNLYAPYILYIGQTYRYSPQYAFYIFSQQINLIIFLNFLSPSSFIPPQNIVYFLMLPFLVRKIFTFYINGVLNCKCPASGPKG